MTNDSMIPFGAQYYRAPTPFEENWEKDLLSFRENGFNTIKIWIQWRWNNPAEGVYDFGDIDRIMDIAAGLGIRVIINMIFDVAPAWFYKKYPESVMVTCDGRRLEPQVTAWRQVGGAPGPCYNHPDGIRTREEFLAAAIQRYKDHPALYMWDLWNEPELTCGIAREPVQKDMVCYCGHCTGQFTGWLKRKYGSVEELNRRWKRNYQVWEEVEAPRSGHTYADMIDWRTFFADTLTQELRWRVETTKGIDAKTPVMVHTVPMPCFNMVNSCNNDYDLAALCDVFGNSTGSSPFNAAFNTSCAKGKRVLNAEIHALGGDTYNRPAIPTFEDIKGHIFIPLARGIKGFLFWQYKPEILGREAPAWGLTRPDRGETPWLVWSGAISRMLQENAALIESVKPVAAKIAIINNYKGQVFNWCASDSIELSCGSLIGAYMAVYDSNLNADILEQELLSAEELSRYSVVYLPFPYHMSKKAAALLRKWVEEGGFLISEAFFGAYIEEEGIHSEIVPGCGFADVFGVREGRVMTASSFKNAYGSQWAENAGEKTVPIVWEEGFAKGRWGNVLTGYNFIEELDPLDAKVICRFKNGMGAVTVNEFGKGKAVMIGSLLGYSCHKGYTEGMSGLLSNMAEMAGIKPAVEIIGAKVRGDILVNEMNEAVLIINSSEKRSLDVKVHVFMDLGEKKQIINLMTEEICPVSSIPDGYSFILHLNAMGHEIYKIV